MNLHAALADPARYRRQIDVLHRKCLHHRRLYELQQAGVSLASVALNRSAVARAIAHDVERGEYQLAPGQIRKITVAGKQRDVFAFRLTDLIVHGVVAEIINEAMAPTLSPRLYSYRKGVSWWQAVDDFASYVCTHRRSHPDPKSRGIYVIRRDLDSYADTIPVYPTSEIWPMLRQLLLAGGAGSTSSDWRLVESVVRPEAFQKPGVLFSQYRGVATGQPISCVLFNLYLREIDRALDQIPNSFYARYCDDLLFASPDPESVKAADSRIHEKICCLALQIVEAKSRTIFLTAAGRPSPEWPLAKGTPSVPFLGCLVSGRGTISPASEKSRRMIRDLEGRAIRTARIAGSLNRDTVGKLVCAAINESLRPRPNDSQERTAGFIRKIATDRSYLNQLDYLIARIVVHAITGRKSARAFREVPYRTVREKWRLISLVDARNRWPA